MLSFGTFESLFIDCRSISGSSIVAGLCNSDSIQLIFHWIVFVIWESIVTCPGDDHLISKHPLDMLGCAPAARARAPSSGHRWNRVPAPPPQLAAFVTRVLISVKRHQNNNNNKISRMIVAESTFKKKTTAGLMRLAVDSWRFSV